MNDRGLGTPQYYDYRTAKYRLLEKEGYQQYNIGRVFLRMEREGHLISLELFHCNREMRTTLLSKAASTLHVTPEQLEASLLRTWIKSS